MISFSCLFLLKILLLYKSGFSKRHYFLIAKSGFYRSYFSTSLYSKSRRWSNPDLKATLFFQRVSTLWRNGKIKYDRRERLFDFLFKKLVDRWKNRVLIFCNFYLYLIIFTFMNQWIFDLYPRQKLEKRLTPLIELQHHKLNNKFNTLLLWSHQRSKVLLLRSSFQRSKFGLLSSPSERCIDKLSNRRFATRCAQSQLHLFDTHQNLNTAC